MAYLGGSRLPSWWSKTVAEADRVLAERYNQAFLRSTEFPVGRVVPPGYDAYTAVLHPLYTEDGARHAWRSWPTPEAYPWPRIDVISAQRANPPVMADSGLAGDRPLVDALVDILSIGTDPDRRYVVQVFVSAFNVDSWTLTVDGATLRRWLIDGRDPEFSAAGRLTVFYPQPRKR